MARYYSTQRPVMPGGFPRKADVVEIKNFDVKTFCEEIGKEAWGYIEYQAITNVIDAVCKPENSFKSLKRKDIYTDWFESREEAEKLVEEAKTA